MVLVEDVVVGNVELRIFNSLDLFILHFAVILYSSNIFSPEKGLIHIQEDCLRDIDSLISKNIARAEKEGPKGADLEDSQGCRFRGRTCK
jgi:hypothetical protein